MSTTSPADRYLHSKSFAYDEESRLTSVTLPAVDDGHGQTVTPIYQYAYDSSGNQTRLTDPLGHVTQFGFDSRSSPVSRTLPLGFGPDGQPGTADDSSTTPADFTESTQYDAFGRVALSISFEGRIKASSYNPASGQLLSERFFDNSQSFQNGSGQPTEVLSYQYDPLGRLIRQSRVSATGTELWTWTYDTQGRLTAAATPTGTVGYEYDPLGRKSRTWTSSVSAGSSTPASSQLQDDTRYTYDALGRLATVSVYERNGQPLSATEIETTRYRYDLAGHLIRQTNANGTTGLHEYDPLGRLTRLTWYAPDSSPANLSNNPRLAEFDDAYNAAGQRTSSTERFWFDGPDADTLPEEHANNITWQYDAAGRLVDELFQHYDDTLSQTEHFSYDLSGNRLSQSVDLGQDGTLDQLFIDQYDANDRLLTETRNNTGVTSTTSHAYNHTQESSKTTTSSTGQLLEQWNYTFDVAGRLASVTGSRPNEATSRAEYRYDDRGIRFASTTSTAAVGSNQFTVVERTDWLNDEQNFTGYEQAVRETVTNASGEQLKTTSYSFGLALISQTDLTGLQSRELTFVQDQLGSTRLLTTADGRIATDPSGTSQVFSYYAGGMAAGFNPDTALTSILYTQQPWDAVAQLQYNRARYLDVNAGRFVGLDPFAGDSHNPQSYNKYLYVHGNPINGVDPTGKEFSLGGLQAGLGNMTRLVVQNATAVGNAAISVGRSTLSTVSTTLVPSYWKLFTSGQWIRPAGSLYPVFQAGWNSFATTTAFRAGFTFGANYYLSMAAESAIEPIKQELLRLKAQFDDVPRGFGREPAQMVLDIINQIDAAADQASTQQWTTYITSQLGGGVTTALNAIAITRISSAIAGIEAIIESIPSWFTSHPIFQTADNISGDTPPGIITYFRNLEINYKIDEYDLAINYLTQNLRLDLDLAQLTASVKSMNEMHADTAIQHIKAFLKSAKYYGTLNITPRPGWF